MDPRWTAALALATGIALLAWDAPRSDDPPSSPPRHATAPGAQPEDVPDGTADAQRPQRFQLDPNFKSFEVTPPPPMTPPPDGPATPPPAQKPPKKPQTITPPPP